LSAADLRVLLLCADIGEGHVTVARALAERLRGRDDVAAVELHTDLEILGPRLGAFLTHGFHLHLGRIGWTYELAYRAFVEPTWPRQAAHLALAALGGRGLRRTIAAFEPDLVVTEYPVLSAALGQLRALGRLAVPVCSSISDPAGLYYWAHPGIDLHLLSWPEAIGEVDRIAGAGKAAAIRPLIDERFMSAAQHEGGSAAPVVLVSGGGWGLGDLVGAAEVALATDAEAIVICLAGRNDRTRAALESSFAGHPRVRLLSFTDRMPELMSRADALIHTTGGTTALEARVVGCPLINYGTGVAHVRAHARAMADLGLAEWAPSRASLGPALRRALTRPRPTPLAVDQLPDAGDLIAQVARWRDGRPTPQSAWRLAGTARASSR
jgi:processive 1,2-diacylglycerol beta-glucosyltransferase